MREWTFPSSSSPTIYRTQIGDNGLLSCTCPGWTVKKLGKPRFCKHCEKVKNDEGLTLEERDGQMFITSFVSGTAGVPHTVTAPPTSTKNPKPASKVKGALNKLQEITDEQTAEDLKKSGFITPMLASAMPEGKTADSFINSDWIMEEKFDGHRLIIRVEEEIHPDDPKLQGHHVMHVKTVTAWSRLGNNRSLPHHIHDLMLDMPVGVYDGELIVPSSQHSYRVTAGQSTGSEALVLFDMIEVDGKSIAKCEQHVRRAFLEIAYGAIEEGQTWLKLTNQFRPSVAAVQDIWDGGGEGAILKKLSAKYNPGWRSPDWIKVKAVANATLTVIGYETGKNGPYSIIRLKDRDGIETTVKTLDNAMMRAFAKDPDNYIGKRVVISYQEKMPSGSYRHPRWDHFAGVGE